MTTNTIPPVNTVEGPVQGVLEGDAVAYKGIPYAAPPTGALRWKPPAAVKTWDKPLQPNEETPSALQNRQTCILVGGGDPDPMNEDCLYLNVWTPQLKAGAAKLPVMVWIHGGSYQGGAGDSAAYDPRRLVEEQDVGVVAVTITGLLIWWVKR